MNKKFERKRKNKDINTKLLGGIKQSLTWSANCLPISIENLSKIERKIMNQKS